MPSAAPSAPSAAWNFARTCCSRASERRVPPAAARSCPISREMDSRRCTSSMISASQLSISVRSSPMRAAGSTGTSTAAGSAVVVLMGIVPPGRGGRRTPGTRNAPGSSGPGRRLLWLLSQQNRTPEPGARRKSWSGRTARQQCATPAGDGASTVPRGGWDGRSVGLGSVTRPAYSDVVMSSAQPALPGTATLQRTAPGSAGRDLDRMLAGLNGPQRDAVVHEGGPLLIVAGAGSGKTRVLTHRIAYLLGARHVQPGEVLAITFTNKAAGEMKERVAQLVGARARAMWVSTFHSMCVRILRAEAAKLGLKSSFTIYDQGDSVRLMTMVARDLALDAKRYPGRSLAAQVSNLKNELIDEESYVPQTAPEKVLAEAYRLYQQRLRQAHAMDFDDLIMNTVHLLQAFPDVAEHYRRRFRHVLVDEYQDTNHAQYVLVRELVGTGEGSVPPAELCVVGDADQSIYAFRGATIRNIDEFERDYPQATTILLEQNYRSTQRILKAANQVISRNTGRRPKNLWTDSGDGELIEGYVADNEHDEAAWVAEQIDALVD